MTLLCISTVYARGHVRVCAYTVDSGQSVTPVTLGKFQAFEAPPILSASVVKTA